PEPAAPASPRSAERGVGAHRATGRAGGQAREGDLTLRGAGLLGRVHGWVHACGALPLIGVVGLGGLGWAAPRIEAASAPPAPLVVDEVLDPDAQIIDAVLARRAPELGLTL